MKKILISLTVYFFSTVSVNGQDSAALRKQIAGVDSIVSSQELTFANVNDAATKLKRRFTLGADDIEGQGNFRSYLSKDGAVYKVGDTLTLGFPSSNKSFAFIITDEGHVFKILNNSGLVYADVSASQSKTIIQNIKIAGSKKAGFYAAFRCIGATGTLRYTIQLENAIQMGEIKRSGMTSDEALTELKRWKDKLDLGLISQEAYDAKKKELSKLIK